MATNVRDPFYRNRRIRDAIHKAIYEKMVVDPRVVIVGEGAHMKVHYDAPDIERDFRNRVITTPIAEGASCDFSLGLALGGLIPIFDAVTADFMLRAFDSICNTCAKHGAISGDPKTIIIRGEFLTGGPTTGQRIESLFAHIPGLRVVLPSNPEDAYDLMKEALEYKGVTVYFEDRMIDDATTPIEPIPFEWSDVSIVSYGLMSRKLTEWNLHHYDLKVLAPLDIQAISNFVIRRHQSNFYSGTRTPLLIVEPDITYMGIGSEIAAQVAESCPGIRIKRLGGPRCVIPASRELHERLLPTEGEVHAAIEELSS